MSIIKYVLILMVIIKSGTTIAMEQNNIENNKRNNLIIYFQNENCKKKCEIFNNRTKITKTDKVFFVNFFNYKNNLKKELSNLNLIDLEENVFFLNNKKIPDSYINILNLKDFNNDIVGEISLKEYDDKNLLKVKFEPKKEIVHKKSVFREERKELVYDNKLENKKIKMKYAIIDKYDHIFPKTGINEGKKIIIKNRVIDYGNKISDNLEWEIKFNKKDYDYENLSIIIWLEDLEKNFIQSIKMDFNREVY